MFLFSDISKLQSLLKQLEVRVATLETKKTAVASPVKPKQEDVEEDDDVDLFGSESEVILIYFKSFSQDVIRVLQKYDNNVLNKIV